uniref:Uncharacterized protein n=1 Tax=viral metagenome TaxID=1070528 RepID=A0A6C0EG07_9ZZZZ
MSNARSILEEHQGLTEEEDIENDIRRIMDNYDPENDTKLPEFLKEYLSLNNKCSDLSLLIGIQEQLNLKINQEVNIDIQNKLKTISEIFTKSLLLYCGTLFGEELDRFDENYVIDDEFIKSIIKLEKKLKPNLTNYKAREDALTDMKDGNSEELIRIKKELLNTMWEKLMQDIGSSILVNKAVGKFKSSTSAPSSASAPASASASTSASASASTSASASASTSASADQSSKDLKYELNELEAKSKSLKLLQLLKQTVNEGKLKYLLKTQINDELTAIIDLNGSDGKYDLTQFLNSGIGAIPVKKTINEIFYEYNLGEIPHFDETVFKECPNALELKIPKIYLDTYPDYENFKALFISDASKFNFGNKLLFILGSGEHKGKLLYHKKTSPPLLFDKDADNTLSKIMFTGDIKNLTENSSSQIKIKDVFEHSKRHTYLVFVEDENPKEGYHLFIISKSINDAYINIEEELQKEEDATEKRKIEERQKATALKMRNTTFVNERTKVAREILKQSEAIFKEDKKEKKIKNEELLKEEIEADVAKIKAEGERNKIKIDSARLIIQQEQESILQDEIMKVGKSQRKELTKTLTILKGDYENSLESLDRFQEEYDIVINTNRLILKEKEMKVKIAEETKKAQEHYTKKIKEQHEIIEGVFNDEYTTQQEILDKLKTELETLTSDLETYKTESKAITDELNSSISAMKSKIEELTVKYKDISEMSDTLSKETEDVLKSIKRDIGVYKGNLQKLLDEAKLTTIDNRKLSSPTVQNATKGILKSSSSTSPSTSSKSVSFSTGSAAAPAPAAAVGNAGGARKGKSRKHLRKKSKKTKKRKASSKKTKRKKSKSTTKKRKKTKRKKRK